MIRQTEHEQLNRLTIKTFDPRQQNSQPRTRIAPRLGVGCQSFIHHPPWLTYDCYDEGRDEAIIYVAIMPQIETFVKFKRAVFSLFYFKRHLTIGHGTDWLLHLFLRRIVRFSTFSDPEALVACYVAAWPLP